MEKNEDNKIWEWVKEQSTKPRTYLILLAISLLIPFVINWLYKLGDRCSSPLIITKWNADDVLSFYGGYLSFLGTTALGVITVYQTKKAHKQTKKANELTERMMKLEEAHFLSMVSVENVYYGIVKYTNASSDKTLFELPYAFKPTGIDLTNGSNPSECYYIDIILKNSSDFHIGKISAVSKFLGDTWKICQKRKGIAPNSKIGARILIPRTKPIGKYPMTIHLYLTNFFEYTTHLILRIEDISNENGAYSFNFDIDRDLSEIN